MSSIPAAEAAPLVAPPSVPVAEPDSSQTAREIARNWLLTVVIGFLVVLCCCSLYMCGRRPWWPWSTIELKVECPDEPSRSKAMEHMRWRLECEERKRNANNNRGISLAFDDAQVDTVQSLLSQ